MTMTRILRFALGLMMLAPAAFSQQAPSGAPAADSPELAALVKREFGDKLQIVTQFKPIVLDIDGDGKPDLALVARGSNAIMEVEAYDVKVVTPYYEHFGYGNAAIVTQYSTDVNPRFVLILHDWRAAKPKAKYMVVGLPIEKFTSGRMRLKKKACEVIENLDSTGIWGATFFDGKKYHWLPIGNDMDAFEGAGATPDKSE